VSDEFFKFPSTPHLTLLGEIDVRDDKVMSAAEREEFLNHPLVVEEKVDGANLGISFDADGNVRAQNRGSYLQLPGAGQWKNLDSWLDLHINSLFEHLLDRYILFGEWCYAKHSVTYTSLPDWFLGFDLYDRQTRHFLSTERRDRLFQKMKIAQTPILARGRFSLDALQEMLTLRPLASVSTFSADPAEGLYLRIDQGEWLLQRAKLVRPAFIQAVEQHWSRSAIEPNQLQVDHSRRLEIRG
jgi:hypothetical protein